MSEPEKQNLAEASLTGPQKKVAVVLFNLGGPDSPAAVRPFLFNLFNDKRIITVPQPFRFFIAWLISRKRTPEAQHIYDQIGGKSPLLEYTQDQANSLDSVLNAGQNKIEYKSFIAMRYWHPMTSVTVEDVKDWAPDHIVLLPLYPQFSTSTTLSSLDEWKKKATQAGLKVSTRATCCYPENDDFIQAHAEQVIVSLDKMKQKTDKPIRLFFSAHGLPQKFIDKGDPYRSQIEAGAAKIENQVRSQRPDLNFESIVTFQSRVGPLEWTSPYTDHEIEKAGSEGQAVLICPVAFVSDHSETLVELGREYRDLAQQSGVPCYDVVPVLGTHEKFIQALADEARRLTGLGPSISSFTGGRYCSQDWAQCPCLAKAE